MFRIATFAALMTCAGLPAVAGGHITLSITGQSAESRQAIRTGLALYALHRDVTSNGHVTQEGLANAAGIYQSGRGHRALIEQHGKGHSGSIDQRGRGHSFGLFQSGRGTSAHVVQRGHGRAGLLFQHGW